MKVSILTSRCTLVPTNFFEPTSAREYLAEVVLLKESDIVEYVPVPQYDAVMVYSSAIDDTVTQIVDEEQDASVQGKALPELYYILQDLNRCSEYNKILCTWKDGSLHIAIAQGKSLLLANVYKAPDFVTAEYFIFLAMKSLQLNPEVSTICWRRSIGAEEEMSLYRYFKAVEQF